MKNIIIIISLITILLLTGCTQINTIKDKLTTTTTPQVTPPQYQDPVPIVVLPPAPKGNLKIHFLDVSQGDSEFIELPNMNTILIDCGDTGQGEKIVMYLNEHNIQNIDALIATHMDEDHIGGCPYIIENFNVKKVYDNGVTTNTQAYQNFIEVADKVQEGRHTITRGQTLDLDSSVKLNILNPPEPKIDMTQNDNSIVLKLEFGDNTFLFEGDCEKNCEKWMIDSNQPISAKYLKVGHHGSTSSSGGQFLKYVSPSTCIIEVGEGNRYGHPHNETLNNLAQYCNILRTDLNGTIDFDCSVGNNWNASSCNIISER